MSFRSYIKDLLRPIVKKSPIALTKGQRIDHLSEQIIKKYCRPTSNCVDVGAHIGDILNIILKASPKGNHFGFEPLPHLYEELKRNYPQVALFNCALSDETATSTFNFVTTNPAYSGIRKRRYDRKNEEVKEIEVELKRMDDCIPANINIDFIKIDVEGAELLTLKGAERILQACKPLLLFEHGMGGADSYHYGPKELYGYLESFDYKIFTLKNFIKGRPHLSLEAICRHFERGDEFYFVAQ